MDGRSGGYFQIEDGGYVWYIPPSHCSFTKKMRSSLVGCHGGHILPPHLIVIWFLQIRPTVSPSLCFQRTYPGRMDTFDTFHPRVFSKRIYWIHSSITLACSPRGYVRYAQKSLRSTLVRLDVLLKDTFNTFKLVCALGWCIWCCMWCCLN